MAQISPSDPENEGTSPDDRRPKSGDIRAADELAGTDSFAAARIGGGLNLKSLKRPFRKNPALAKPLKGALDQSLSVNERSGHLDVLLRAVLDNSSGRVVEGLPNVIRLLGQRFTAEGSVDLEAAVVTFSALLINCLKRDEWPGEYFARPVFVDPAISSRMRASIFSDLSLSQLRAPDVRNAIVDLLSEEDMRIRRMIVTGLFNAVLVNSSWLNGPFNKRLLRRRYRRDPALIKALEEQSRSQMGLDCRVKADTLRRWIRGEKVSRELARSVKGMLDLPGFRRTENSREDSFANTMNSVEFAQVARGCAIGPVEYMADRFRAGLRVVNLSTIAANGKVLDGLASNFEDLVRRKVVIQVLVPSKNEIIEAVLDVRVSDAVLYEQLKGQHLFTNPLLAPYTLELLADERSFLRRLNALGDIQCCMERDLEATVKELVAERKDTLTIVIRTDEASLVGKQDSTYEALEKHFGLDCIESIVASGETWLRLCAYDNSIDVTEVRGLLPATRLLLPVRGNELAKLSVSIGRFPEQLMHYWDSLIICGEDLPPGDKATRVSPPTERIPIVN